MAVVSALEATAVPSKYRVMPLPLMTPARWCQFPSSCPEVVASS
jgi:hypothetical protein